LENSLAGYPRKGLEKITFQGEIRLTKCGDLKRGFKRQGKFKVRSKIF